MKAKLASVLALGLGLALAAPESAIAQGTPPKAPPSKDAAKGGKAAPPAAKKDAKKEAAEPPSTAKPIAWQPKDLTWGIDQKKLGAIYDKVIEEDYKPRYLKAQPGPETERLDAEVAERKAEFRRSLTKFESTTTGYDSTPLKEEYSYGNKESLMLIERGGKTRYFLFIGDKLWKMIDVIKLGEKSKWGKTFDEGVAHVNKAYGVEGRVREPDPAQQRPFKEVDWKDATNHVRAIDWGGDKLAIAFEDSATVANLGNLRKNKKDDATRVDDKVKDAGRKKEPEPPPKDQKPGKGPPPKQPPPKGKQ
jgi:hypothetical protein